jgi:hypothetical protein
MTAMRTRARAEIATAESRDFFMNRSPLQKIYEDIIAAFSVASELRIRLLQIVEH